MTDWREQLLAYLDKQEPGDYSWANPVLPGRFYADSAFEPSPEEITQFLKDIGHDDHNTR